MSCLADKLPISTFHIVFIFRAAPISLPSSFQLSEWNWRETGSYWSIGEGGLNPEASRWVSATSVRVVVDVGINVIYRTQVLALICIQSLAVTRRWSSRPPLTLPWANQMLDFYNSYFRSMCLKKIPLLSFGTQCLSKNHGILPQKTFSWKPRPAGRVMTFQKNSQNIHSYSRGTQLWVGWPWSFITVQVCLHLFMYVIQWLILNNFSRKWVQILLIVSSWHRALVGAVGTATRTSLEPLWWEPIWKV